MVYAYIKDAMVKAVKGPARGSPLQKLFNAAKTKDPFAVGQLLSLVEKDLRKAAPFLAELEKGTKGRRLGITGPPGAGKSTLINLLIPELRRDGLTVAVLAVDPSSPFSGGALLGDRVRMHGHEIDAGLFIRSVGSRGGFGGLSAATGAMATVLEGCGFDVVIIETVGVGQTELQITHLADATALVLVPESGDVIQTMKAGVLEIADLFVVNKSDRAGGDILARELKAMGEQEQAPRPVLLTSGLKNEGISEFKSQFLSVAEKLAKKRRSDPERRRAELRNLFVWTLDQDFQKLLRTKKIEGVYRTFAKWKSPRIK